MYIVKKDVMYVKKPYRYFAILDSGWHEGALGFTIICSFFVGSHFLEAVKS